MKKIIFCLVVLTVTVIFSLPAHALITNPGFETGDLSGWNAPLGNAYNTTQLNTGYHVIDPVEGNNFAYIESGNMNVFYTLSQAFSVANNSVLSFSALFTTTDYMPFNDEGYWKLYLDSAVVASESENVSGVGNYGSTGWGFFELDLIPGNYLLELGVRNIGDGGVDSYVAIDGLNISNSGSGVDPIPEPATMVLFSTGILGLFGYKRKRK